MIKIGIEITEENFLVSANFCLQIMVLKRKVLITNESSEAICTLKITKNIEGVRRGGIFYEIENKGVTKNAPTAVITV